MKKVILSLLVSVVVCTSFPSNLSSVSAEHHIIGSVNPEGGPAVNVPTQD